MKKLVSILLTVVVIVIGKYVIVAQETTTGTWRGEYRAEKSEKVQINFSRKSDAGRNNSGTSFELSELGLSASQLTASSNTPVRFSLRREAGTIDCEGTFNNGKGSGTFRFTPNPQFVAGMKSRGFDFEKRDARVDEDEVSNRLFGAAMFDITMALADDLLSSDFGKLGVDDLFKAKIFNIDGKFAREMKETGFKNLSFDDLVKARIFKVDAAFVREVAQMGLENEDFESLVKMRIFKISPEFIAGVRAEGLTDLDIEDLVKLRIFNIDADFIRKGKSEGVPLDVEKLVQKRIGVFRN